MRVDPLPDQPPYGQDRVQALLARETQEYAAARPRSAALAERAATALFAGVPMPWMLTWAGEFPLYMAHAEGATLVDVDGHEYVDFCLGDSAAMAGHSPPSVARAIADRAETGISAMLPTEDALWVGEELGRRFGLPVWQFTLSATDANRSAIRFARQITRRPKVLVFNRSYHGSVDEALVTLVGGEVGYRDLIVGPVGDPSQRSRVVEFNDLGALEAALAAEDVACVLAEPALTNIGIVLPDDGFHAALRDVTRRHGTLLVIDETHTACTGPGGATAAHGLEPDMLVMGKWLGSGIPSGALGMTAGVAGLARTSVVSPIRGPSGVGGTVAGNAMSLRAMRATLASVLTEDAYAGMIDLATRWSSEVAAVITEALLPWHVVQLGCRAEYRFRPSPPRNGADAAAVIDPALDRYLHLGCLNRGVLMTPFHSMALMSPAHGVADVERHTVVFSELVDELVA